MDGWINESVKALLVTKFGAETWEKILEKVRVTSDECLIHEKDYEATTCDLVSAAFEVLGSEQSHFLDDYGVFFIHFVKSAGYANLLECLGSDLRSWLSNLDKLGNHLRVTLPHIRTPNIK